MFPKKLVADYCEGCSTEIDVVRSLHKEIPYFLRWVQGDDDSECAPKFNVDDVEKVKVMTVDTSVDPINDMDVWGVGLQVFLKNEKYFLIYMPMHYESILEEVYSYWFEVHESIQVVDSSTDVNTLPQMKAWRTNLYKYNDNAHHNDEFVWTNHV